MGEHAWLASHAMQACERPACFAGRGRGAGARRRIEHGRSHKPGRSARAARPAIRNAGDRAMSRMDFELLGTDGVARRGRISFPRGTIETPAFMPVGTYGTVKGVLPGPARATWARRSSSATPSTCSCGPGLEVIEAHGGLHGFARWDKPILTDSGGFQVFSLAHRRKITEQGVTFAAPTDGSKVFLGPEESMRIQKVLGSDIVMIFDECPPVTVDGAAGRQARGRALDGTVAALGRTLEAGARGQRRGAVRHRPGRRAPRPAHAFGGGSAARSASTATRSAAWRSARPRPSATPCSSTPRRSCRRTARAT